MNEDYWANFDSSHKISGHRYGPSEHRLCFEYRTTDDSSLPKTFEGHDRRYIDHTDLVGRLRGLGYVIEIETASQGLAVYGEEDPFAGRVIARRVSQSTVV